jgi:very-short-patch-repair endonuclease
MVEFYCPTERLCIELDGHSHESAEAQKHDEAKDLYLRSCHIRVLRFRNEEVSAGVGRVVERTRGEWKRSPKGETDVLTGC